MFARIKKSGKYQYLQIVENRKEGRKVRQRVIATIGRMDRLNEKNGVEELIRSLSKYSEKTLLIISGKSDISAESKVIGPSLIFERLWRELGIPKALKALLVNRKYEFDIERAVFLTVLHRLMVSGSDRYCHKWRRDYIINGTECIDLHHLYRAMAFLGEESEDQIDATPFSPRCNKELIEEEMFSYHRDLFTDLELVFFDTTSIYFEGEGGENLGERGYSKDHRPDLRQMVIGVVINKEGRPICCEVWPGNTADVKTLIPVANRLRKRFSISRFCIVADRGMISSETIELLEKPETGIPYILGARMRNVNEVKTDVLSRAGRYSEVHSDGMSSKFPSPLKIKEVYVKDNRYIVCMNVRQARKDAKDRAAIIRALRDQIKKNPKSLVGNKGYRKYSKIEKNSVSIDANKVRYEARFDGKWVLKTNTDMSAREVALKYKELWMVERIFRDVKTILETRPVFHQRDETIRGHVFCSFLALILRKELERRLEKRGYSFEWRDMKDDLNALREVVIEESGRRLAIRTTCQGNCGKIFQSVGVTVPPAIREI